MSNHPYMSPPVRNDDHWSQRGLCSDDPEAPYRRGRRNVEAMLERCAACPVRATCLQDALDRDERWGVWGGTTPSDRRRLQDEATGAAGVGLAPVIPLHAYPGERRAA